MSDKEMSVTELRAHIYAVIDRMIKTGEPQLLERNGRRIKLYARPERKPAKAKPHKVINDLSKLTKPKRSAMTGPPEWYISPKLAEWDPDHDLD